MQIAGKTVLITGANRGIGQALVGEALRRGARRVYAGTREPISGSDGRVVTVGLDVTDPEQISRAVEQVGALDVLINNAGIAIYDDLSDQAVLQQHLAVNLFGTYNVTQAFLPLLTRSGGAVVNNLSMMALAPLPLTPAYAVSKAAAFNLTQSLRALLARRGVSVHAILTGPTDTDMTRGFEVPKASPESVAQAIFDGLARDEDDIFPDPMSASIAEFWRSGAVKALERELATAVPADAVPSFTTTFLVDQTPEEAFAAILDVRAWWSGNIEGSTDHLDAEFTYRYQDIHYSKQRITELVPGRRVAWQVLDAYVDFTEDPREWVGTEVTFDVARAGNQTEVRFSHLGLVPDFECYDKCSSAWSFYINGSLKRLMTGGQGSPNPREETAA